jgi:hypothetical protein
MHKSKRLTVALANEAIGLGLFFLLIESQFVLLDYMNLTVMWAALNKAHDH